MPTKSATLKFPDKMNAILPAYIREGTAEPQFKEVKEKWLNQSIKDCPAALKEEATDMAFFPKQKTEYAKSGWTSFNETHSEIDPKVSTLGYMPIILAPAHEFDTVQRIFQVAESFNLRHVI